MKVSPFLPSAAPGTRPTAVSTVLVKRVPNSGPPSTSGWVMLMTLPSWISAAAAFVTAGVTRLVAPVWSSGPNGEASTRVLQSLWASAGNSKPSSPMQANPASTNLRMFPPGSPDLIIARIAPREASLRRGRSSAGVLPDRRNRGDVDGNQHVDQCAQAG